MTPARRVGRKRVTNEDVIDLLRIGRRLELNAIVRLVKQRRDKLNPTIAVENWGKGYIEACDDLLSALTKRQKGTR